jgi:hypothetical protein
MPTIIPLPLATRAQDTTQPPDSHLLASRSGLRRKTVRAYAGERLLALGEAEQVRQRHAPYFLGRDGWLAPDHDNLAAALAWARHPDLPSKEVSAVRNARSGSSGSVIERQPM